jgi:serine/threonine protein phosphatase 1
VVIAIAAVAAIAGAPLAWPAALPHIRAMITRLFGRGRPAEGVAPQVPPGSRIYAVGDIHGRADLLRHLHQLIHEDAYGRQAPRNVVVYLGDYIDRGKASAEVIDLLIDEPLPSFEAVHLKGNHEDSLLRFLDDTSVGAAWFSYGGDATLESYGVRPVAPAAPHQELLRAQRELALRLPERHRRFLAALTLAHEEGDYLFVHAGIRPGLPLRAQNPADLLWIRDEFLSSSADFGKIIVHGHSISARPDVQRNRIGIDTGAFASNVLTCLILEGSDWSFLQT